MAEEDGPFSVEEVVEVLVGVLVVASWDGRECVRYRHGWFLPGSLELASIG